MIESLDDDDLPPPATPPRSAPIPKPKPETPPRLAAPVDLRPKAPDREPPHSIEAEEAVLACMLLDPDSVAQARLLFPDSFYSAANRLLFEVILEVAAKEGQCDIAMLAQALKQRRQLTGIGGMAFLLQVTQAAPTTAQFRFMLDRVRELSALRELIRRAAAAVERAYEVQGDYPEFIQSVATDLGALTKGQTRLLPAKRVDELKLVRQSDRTCLLGNRFLNRGDGAILSSSSGMGKSSMMLQMAVSWALGLEFMGIKPNGPLRSLIIQSEDSEGDVAEVWESICHELKLTPAQRGQIGEMVSIVTDRVHRGDSFIAEAGAQIRRHRPDLVWVNPLAAFAGGDISDAEQLGIFLREQLNGLNAACEFAWFLVTHTTKPPSDKGKTERKWSEVMYDMAGSYELIGWARAILSLRATDSQGEFDLVLAKRGTRADVMVEVESDGGIEHLQRTTVITLRHAVGKFKHPALPTEIPLVFWEKRKAARQGKSGRPKTKGFEQYLVIIPPVPEKALGIRQMHRLAAEIAPVSISTFFTIINAAVDDGLVARDLSNPRLPRFYLNSAPRTS